MENWWTIIGTLLGAIIAGTSVILNSHYSSKSAQKRENKNRLIDEKELETLYQESLHLLDKLIRNLGSLEEKELEDYYKMEIQIELISTKEITKKIVLVRKEISKMVKSLPKMPDEFIPKFESDDDRQWRLSERKKVRNERNDESKKFLSNIRSEYTNLSELMKVDLQKRRILDIDKYIEYRKKN